MGDQQGPYHCPYGKNSASRNMCEQQFQKHAFGLLIGKEKSRFV
jgi:hypothetical protein